MRFEKDPTFQSIKPQDLDEKIEDLLLINNNDQKRSSSCVCSVTRPSGRLHKTDRNLGNQILWRMTTLSCCRQFTTCGTPASTENLAGSNVEIPGTELINDKFTLENRQVFVP